MKLGELGEFELIEKMARVFRPEGAAVADAAAAFSRLDVGIGDDAAVWRPTPGRSTIATADAVVEGVHFTIETTSWYDLGWKAMASNLSDIAGMGGAPRYALAVLGTDRNRDEHDVLDLCRGMADIARRFGAEVVGGDTVSSPVTTLSITVLGESIEADGAEAALLSRYAARPGYEIAVTGTLGSSAGGFELLRRGGQEVPPGLEPLVRAHCHPMPRVTEGQMLVQVGVPCGMDMSDGLVQDLTRICLASNVSAAIELDRLPMDPLLPATFGERAVEMALSGGEDYELLCLAPPDVMARAISFLEAAGRRLTVVGWAEARDPSSAPVMLLDSDGNRHSPRRMGWDHFSARTDAAGS